MARQAYDTRAGHSFGPPAAASRRSECGVQQGRSGLVAIRLPWASNDIPAAAPDWVLAALKAFLASDALATERSASPVEWRFESRYFSSLLYFTIVTRGS